MTWFNWILLAELGSRCAWFSFEIFCCVRVFKASLFISFILANAAESDKRDLNSELELMKTLKPHPHVIKLLGCVNESGKNNIFLRGPFYPHIDSPFYLS